MFGNRVNLTLFRLLCVLCIVFISLLSGRLSSAAQQTTSGGDIRTIYYGKVTTFSKLIQEVGTKVYCANQVTPEMQKRGYGDPKLDSIICFNTASEMKAQGDLNQKVESAVPRGPLSQITPTQSNSGAEVRPLSGSGYTCVPNTRFALYQYEFYSGFLADICSQHTQESNLSGISSMTLYGLACMQVDGGYPRAWNTYSWTNEQVG